MVEIKKIYGVDYPEMNPIISRFLTNALLLREDDANSLLRTITSLHLYFAAFVSYQEQRVSGLRRGVDKSPARLSGEKMPLFPIFLKLTKRRCLVVGAGKTAEEKIPSLMRCGASVIVVAPVATRTIQAWAADNKIVWEQRRFEPRDLDGIYVAVVATPSKTLNRTIFELAEQRQILCNVVRDRPLCNFYHPAVVRRGPLQIAISTAGHSGALAQRLRKQLEEQFGPEWESWLRWLGEARSSLYDDPLSPKRRRTMLHRLASQKKQAEFFDRWGVTPSNGSRQRK
jgi:precorrin-2 dehydrogenase/sirohydrochlorin ferrochelatase